MCYVCGRMGHDDWHCTQATNGKEAEYQYGEWFKANGSYNGTQYKGKTRKNDSTMSSGGSEETRPQPPMAVMGNMVTDNSSGVRKSSDCQESEKAND